MARAGLSEHWKCVWSNDFCESKSEIYRRNWGGDELVVRDVGQLDSTELPVADLAWGSFPCQDLSLAGSQRGIGDCDSIQSTRSGSFWPFWKLARNQRPKLVVLENVVGMLSANGGADFGTVCSELAFAGYNFGPLVIDAQHWLPQSRPRLFIVAVRSETIVPERLIADEPSAVWHPDAVLRAHRALPQNVRAHWVWWYLRLPVTKPPPLEALIEREPSGWVDWDDREKTDYLLSLMNGVHRKKLLHAKEMRRRVIGTGYRRTREGRQHLEVRFDGIAGCLRTAGGGSSKQVVVEVEGDRVRTRLLSPREAARLQGLPDSYWLPPSYNEAYDLVGDGLCVPAVAHLSTGILAPLARSASSVVRMSA